MMATRRCVLVANNAPLASGSRRVYLTQTRPPPTCAQHVRGYRSSLQNPYFASSVMIAAPEQASSSSTSWWQQVFQWYSQKLTTHPLLTKALTGATIAAAGDVVCQAGTHDSETKGRFWDHWDFRRSLHFFLLGGTFVAPTSHYWYGNLAVHPWTKGQCFRQISLRVALDQFVWSPVFFVIWLGGFWGLERNGNVTGAELQRDLKTALPDVLVANWILWIPCQYLNFYAVPIKFQVLFTNVVELVWNAYLSFATDGGGHGGGQKQIEEETKQPEVDVYAEER